MLSGFISLSITMCVRLLVAVVIFLHMASVWNAQAYGEFMYLFSVATLFVMMVDYGFSNQILKEVGGNPKAVQSIMAAFIGIKLWITGTALFLFLPILLRFLKMPGLVFTTSNSASRILSKRVSKPAMLGVRSG